VKRGVEAEEGAGQIAQDPSPDQLGRALGVADANRRLGEQEQARGPDAGDAFQIVHEALRVALTPAESKNLVKDRPRDVRAYDLYLKGREHYGRYNAESLPVALDLFQQATAVDPSYALAWAGIADTHAQMVAWNYAKDPAEALRLGLEAANRAIDLNPRLPEAYKARSLVLRYSGDDAGAKAALVKAIEIDPRFIPALTNLAVYAVAEADLAGGERLLRRAIECDGAYPFTVAWLAWLLVPTRRYDEALAVVSRLRQLSDDTF